MENVFSVICNSIRSVAEGIYVFVMSTRNFMQSNMFLFYLLSDVLSVYVNKCQISYSCYGQKVPQTTYVIPKHLVQLSSQPFIFIEGYQVDLEV